ncbi:STAS domain-containing protein [Vitiosangium sp. GDMCC 1.1324]|uniref:STAS domain-containing protein n=1 Tax=Vitiosangium sp. (strain GDMCC 1.1324) TaxID=2138576 RepID=UPI000D3A829A|nr:STAS domain-containing protein [Vitiosangium sp. GDMCC 1.1324]PTL84967.1 anti-sigma factor antagonist [Vitiosangium sp. GDMCC 1.1324]
MKLTRTDHGDETTIVVEGTLDITTAQEFRDMADKVTADNRKKVVLETSALHLIDSSGVAVIMSLYKRVQTYEGELTISGLQDQPRQIFRLLRLDKVFSI